MTLEYNLKKTGQLNKPSDVTSFWDHMFHQESIAPQGVRGKRQSQQKQESPYHLRSNSHPSKILKDLHELEEEETAEHLQGGYTNSWAITAQPPDENVSHFSRCSCHNIYIFFFRKIFLHHQNQIKHLPANLLM